MEGSVRLASVRDTKGETENPLKCNECTKPLLNCGCVLQSDPSSFVYYEATDFLSSFGI